MHELAGPRIALRFPCLSVCLCVRRRELVPLKNHVPISTDVEVCSLIPRLHSSFSFVKKYNLEVRLEIISLVPRLPPLVKIFI